MKRACASGGAGSAQNAGLTGHPRTERKRTRNARRIPGRVRHFPQSREPIREITSLPTRSAQREERENGWQFPGPADTLQRRAKPADHFPDLLNAMNRRTFFTMAGASAAGTLLAADSP